MKALIGYMASEIYASKVLAEALVLPFIDLDVEIELTGGTAISEIITAKANCIFASSRVRYSDIHSRARNRYSHSEVELQCRQSHGIVERARGDHFLDVPVGELAKRFKGDIKRPLIQNKEDVAEFERLTCSSVPHCSRAKHRMRDLQ